ncbi:CRISPR-associated exonuclease Csa1 [Sulfuracidifex tepidarius]|uniref:CRISPR-associated exonuclease Csa1 n=1 Tax=Sulfuracidifex tepidarius TaxID=1294262 RepID=A0A510DYE0_9CREN|nr:type I-A CRISPR-associated protein Cas4/Csa1 [Sulfuracidifex tepidarius]BBG24968.1 CRISPR-associated exonuclease Csa1 [Sulfuracidifex tepidarius]
MFFTLSDVMLLSRRTRSTPRSISEELRGWNWSEPPVYPPSTMTLGVSDLTNGLCPTGRFAFLKYTGKKVEVKPLPGASVHEVYAKGIETVKRLIYEEDLNGARLRTLMEDEFYSLKVEDLTLAKAIWDRVVNTYSAELDKAKGRSPYFSRDSLASMVVPFSVEFPLDGTLVGLHNGVRADAFIPHVPMIAEMKTGKPRRQHELALTGYALAYESMFEYPMDFGYLCYVQVKEGRVFDSCRLVQVGDYLRDEFLQMRDKVMESIENGVEPEKPKRCDQDCPFLKVCNP